MSTTIMDSCNSTNRKSTGNSSHNIIQCTVILWVLTRDGHSHTCRINS